MAKGVVQQGDGVRRTTAKGAGGAKEDRHDNAKRSRGDAAAKDKAEGVRKGIKVQDAVTKGNADVPETRDVVDES